LSPGVVGHCTDFIEPSRSGRRAADPLRQPSSAAKNVLAGTDCGLGTRVGHPSICWAKFEALAEGARTRDQGPLWGGVRASRLTCGGRYFRRVNLIAMRRRGSVAKRSGPRICRNLVFFASDSPWGPRGNFSSSSLV